MLGTVTQLAKGKITAVVLGAAGVGVLSQLTSMWSLVSIVVGLGLYNGMVRNFAHTSKDGEQCPSETLLSTSFILMIVMSLVAVLAACLYSHQVSHYLFADDGDRSGLVCLVLASIPFFATSQVYRALLNSAKAISFLGRSRIVADVASVFFLALFIYPLGIRGAVLAFVALHLVFMCCVIVYATKIFGTHYVVPSLAKFSWADAKENSGFGANSLLVSVLGVGGTIVIFRWVIAAVGLEESGYLAVAIKVSSLYLGGLYAAGSAHYFPTLVLAKNSSETGDIISQTLSFYMYVVPPMAILIMMSADELLVILFTREFVPAAALLLFFLTADLFRVVAEALSLPLVANRRLFSATALYAIWAISYVALTYVLLPHYGLLAVAYAYLASHLIHAGLAIVIVRRELGYRIPLRCVLAVFRGAALLGLGAISFWWIESRVLIYLVGIFFLVGWCLVSLRDDDFHDLVTQALKRVGQYF